MKRLALPALLSSLALGAALLVGGVVNADPPAKQLVCHSANGKLVELEVADEAAEKGHRKHGDYPPQAYFADTDGDGYGAGAATEGCTQPAGYVPSGGDCAPDDNAISPGAKEVCDDKKDNDCDGEIDEGCVTTPPGSHQVELLLHCDPNSAVLGSYGVGTHTLAWEVRRNISFVRFVGGTTGKVTLKNCDGRTMDLTTNTNLCSLEGGCCGTGRWNDEVCEITVY